MGDRCLELGQRALGDRFGCASVDESEDDRA